MFRVGDALCLPEVASPSNILLLSIREWVFHDDSRAD